MSEQPVDVDYVVQKVKGTRVSNVSFWVFLSIGVIVVIGLGRLSRVLGLLGLGGYLLFTVVQGLSVAFSTLIGIADLFGLLGRSRSAVTKLWRARAIQAAEFGGLCLLTLILYRNFF